MIRCIPVDGSATFEIRNTSTLDRWEGRSHIIDYADVIATHAEARAFTWTPRHEGRDVACRIESWRERAERLEKELAALHSAALTTYGETVALDRALDTIAKRCLSEHG